MPTIVKDLLIAILLVCVTMAWVAASQAATL